MNIPIQSSGINSLANVQTRNAVKNAELENKLKLDHATDEELLKACKSFESYMIEQVFKEMKKTVKSEEDESDYLKQFSDILYEEYASKATENSDFGIAKTLYESMKRNRNFSK